MFAVTAIVSESATSHEFHRGLFYNCPPELVMPNAIRNAIKNRKAGWSRTEYGYWKYSFVDGDDSIIIFPGLILEEEPMPSKYFSSERNIFTRRQIENYAKSIVDFLDRTRADTEKYLNMLVHDLRGISSSIYNAAIEALRAVKVNDLIVAEERIDSVIASQAMLKMRTDVIDYIGNPSSIVESINVPIYKRVHKVCRSFNAKGNSRQVSIKISGSSYNSVKGPDIFEIVPYIFIDNAIKYAPKGSSIDVFVLDSFGETFIRFVSLGPRISDQEKFDIFTRGYRGIHALDSAKPGSGLGLSLARNVIENHFSGVITVHQEKTPETIDGNDYFSTEFHVTVPSFPV
jgi:signal transduction histidine kinase